MAGSIVASHFGPHLLVFGISVFILGLLSAVAHPDRSAYRFAGVSLAIVMLVPRTGPAWQTAFHRFAEVSIGIGVAHGAMKMGQLRYWPGCRFGGPCHFWSDAAVVKSVTRLADRIVESDYLHRIT